MLLLVLFLFNLFTTTLVTFVLLQSRDIVDLTKNELREIVAIVFVAQFFLVVAPVLMLVVFVKWIIFMLKNVYLFLKATIMGYRLDYLILNSID